MPSRCKSRNSAVHVWSGHTTPRAPVARKFRSFGWAMVIPGSCFRNTLKFQAHCRELKNYFASKTENSVELENSLKIIQTSGKQKNLWSSPCPRMGRSVQKVSTANKKRAKCRHRSRRYFNVLDCGRILNSPSPIPWTISGSFQKFGFDYLDWFDSETTLHCLEKLLCGLQKPAPGILSR